ncbi:hypothetical protein [Deinococcus sp.]|uniref:hypothetical protein n=1 Tax=Deinococcus sp. TaxID=47478 RepID=UPI003CC5D3A5
MTNEDPLEFKSSINSMYGHIHQSQRYAKGAILFAAYAEHIEKSVDYPDRYVNYHINCSSSIIFSYLCLEAYINELHYWLITPEKFSEELQFHKYPLDSSTRSKLEHFISARSDKTLEKYIGIALTCANLELKTGDILFQNVNLLSKLRNELVHYKLSVSTLIEDGKLIDPIANLKEKLTGKFTLNPLTHSDGFPDLYFPDQVVSLGAAQWAYRSVYEFIDDFHGQISWPPHERLPEPPKF